jgi:hypothetical protein
MSLVIKCSLFFPGEVPLPQDITILLAFLSSPSAIKAASFVLKIGHLRPVSVIFSDDLLNQMTERHSPRKLQGS